MDLSNASRQSIVLNNSEGAFEGADGLKSSGGGLSELDKKIHNIEEILASRGEQASIDMRRFVILKTLATQGRLPTVEELEDFGGGAVTPSEARSAKQQVEQIPDMIWEDEVSAEGTEERNVPTWKKALEEQWAAEEAKGRRARYENDEALKLYSLNRQYSIMNTMKRENRWVTNADLNRDGREAPMKPSELVAAMRAQKQITEDMEHGKHSRLEADRVLYRGAGSFYTNLLKKTFGVREGDSEEVMRRKMQGGCITDKALMSSTLAPIKAKEFADNGTQQGETGTIIQLYAPRGTKGQYIAPISAYQNEREMLLNNDTCIRIVDVGNYKAAPEAKDKRNYLQIRGAITAGNLLGAHRRKQS